MLIDIDALDDHYEITPSFETAISSLARETDKSALTKRLKPYLVWNRPRTHFNYWVPVVNTIDRELLSIVSKYGLQEEHPKLQLLSSEDEDFVTTCLHFTTTLLENTTGSELYNSAENVYHLIKSASLDVRLAAMEVALCVAQIHAETNFPNLAASKEVKNTILKLAKSFPPLVPSTFTSRKLPDTDDPETPSKSDERPVVLGDHFCLVDTITTDKKYPSRWGSLCFPYYSTEASLLSSALLKKMTVSAKKSKPNEETSYQTGLQKFILSEELVRKLSLEQIYDRASVAIPQESWFDFSLAATTAKAFNTKSYESWKLREILLKIKCLLIGYICSMCSSQFTSSRLLEVEPYSLSFIVELIQPDNAYRVSDHVYYAAVRSLQVISAKKVWGPDLMRCMGANVSHGMLFHCLRHMYKQLANEDPKFFEKGSIAFLNMLGNLIRVKSLATKLAAGDLLSDLLPFLSLRTNHRRTLSAVVNYTAMFCRVQPEACTDFINRDGFNILIGTIQYEVDFALNNPAYDGGCPASEAPTFYRIGFRLANYIRNLMRFVVSLIESDLGDRLRNLFDTPILKSFNKILENPSLFGPQIVSATIDSVFDIIHNEPTAYAILKEANVIQNIVTRYETLFSPSIQVILSLAEVLGAICLNKEGLAMVTDCKCIDTFFNYLLRPDIPGDFTKEACNPGSSFEELARHYPELRPIIIDQISRLLNDLLLKMKYGDQAIQLFKKASNGSYFCPTADNHSLLSDLEESLPVCAKSKTIRIFDNVLFFLGGLGGLLQDSGKLAEEVVDRISIEDWIGLITQKNVPYDFVASDAFGTLLWILKILDDEDTHYAFIDFIMDLLYRFESPSLEGFLLYEDTNVSYFESQFSSDPEGGTAFLRELSALHSLLYATVEAYLSLEASDPQKFDDLLQHVAEHKKSLPYAGKLLCRCIIEETLIRESLPSAAAAATVPRFSRSIGKYKPTLYTDDPKSEKQTFRDYRVYNTKQVRFLLLGFQTLLPTFFKWVGRVCLEKRDIGEYCERSDAIHATQALANIFKDAFVYSFDSLYRKACFVYAITGLFKVCLTLQHHGTEFCVTPLYMLYFQTGVFDGFEKWVEHLWPLLIQNTTKTDYDVIASRNYVGADLASVLYKAFTNLVEIFEKPSAVELWCAFTEARYFFELFMWVEDPESVIRNALTMQMQFYALLVLSKLIGSKSAFLSGTELESISHLPLGIIKMMEQLCTNAVLDPLDLPGTKYYPLDSATMFPSIEKIRHLTDNGIQEHKAISFFRANDKSQLNNPQKATDLKLVPSHLAKEVCPMSPDDAIFKSSFNGGAESSHIADIRESEKPALWGFWLYAVSVFPDMGASVAQLFKIIKNTNLATTELVDEFKIQNSLNPKKATACIRVVKELCDGIPGSTAVDTFVYFTEYLSAQLENIDVLAEPHIVEALGIFVQALAWNLSPNMDPVMWTDLPLPSLRIDSRIPGFLDHAMVRKIFSSLSQVTNVSNQTLAIELVKLMILFATDFELLEQIASSLLLKELIAFPRSHWDKPLITESFKTALTILVRRCYETESILNTTFQVLLPRATFFPKLQLWRVVESHACMAMRSPLIYSVELSKLIYLEDFTDERPSTLVCRLPVSKQEMMQTTSDENSRHLPKAPVFATGVVHMLLAQLMEVINSDWLSTPPESDVVKSKSCEINETKRGKEAARAKTKEAFKNRNFSYICFLVQTLAELLGSYKQAKLEFLTFSRKKTDEEIKTRSTALNFFLHRLVPAKLFDGDKGVEHDRRHAVSTLAKNALVSLISSPFSEKNLSSQRLFEDADISFIRLFFLDILSKVFKDTAASKKSTTERYGKFFDTLDLCGMMLTPKVRESILCDKQTTKDDVFFITKGMLDKLIATQVASVMGELDLNFPDVKRLIKAAVKLLTLVGSVKHEYHRDFEEGYQGEKEDDDIVPDEDDDGEETRDLLRNSTLGMYEIESGSDSDQAIEFYDDGPLEVLMEDGEEVDSDEGSSGMSDFDSETEHEFGLDDGDDDHEVIDDDDEDDADEQDRMDVEMAYDSDDEGLEDESSRFFGFDDEDASSEVFDDEELDQWIERFEGGADADSSSDEESNYEVHEESAMIGGHHDVRRNIASSSSHSDHDMSGSDDNEEDEVSHPIMRTLENSMRGAPEIASLLNRFVGEGSILQGHIMINGMRHSLGHFDHVLDQAFGPGLQIGRLRTKIPEEGSNFMNIKSTRERWQDAMEMFPYLCSAKIYLRVGAGIVNRVAGISMEIQKEKVAKMEKLRKEREERLRKFEQRRRKLLKEEAAQRQVDVAESRTEPLSPVMMRIGDREVDISGTDIDPEFFEALPDEMREEVFTQHIRERRATAGSSGLDSREIDPDFLNALPDQIRHEILLQEVVARRFSSLGSARFDDFYDEGTMDFDDSMGDIDDEEMEEYEDDEGDEDNEEGDEDSEEEHGDAQEITHGSTNSILSNTIQVGASNHGNAVSLTTADERTDLDGDGQNMTEPTKTPKRVFFTPLFDRQGVAAVIRLLFAPLAINQREWIYQSLHFMCFSKQTRGDVINMILAILHDGKADHRSLDKIYAQLCARATGVKDTSKLVKLPLGISPLAVAIQIMEALDYLLERNSHMRYYLLMEHENPFLLKKVTPKEKILRNLPKESKYPINLLLATLEVAAYREDQTFMDILARVLQISTRRLLKIKDSNAFPFPPPTIPDHNYRRIIQILTANDCSNATFRRTISAMQNLSLLGHSQKLFSLELSDQASTLGHTIIADLIKLTRELEKGNDFNTETKTFSKFRAASSDQAKLLRVLTALDYMYESKERESSADVSAGKFSTSDIEELTALYQNLALGSLWDALSDCLQVLGDRPELTSVSSALLPLIEALMVVCKHSKVKDYQIKDVLKYEAKKVDFANEPIESLFFTFTDEHKKILNQMVRTNPNLMSGPFGMLVRNPRVLEFDNKRNYFDRMLHKEKGEDQKLAISVRRDQVFLDSYRSLFFKSKSEFSNSKLDINFKGEAGVDAGGVTREWYQVLSRQMFNPDYALFTPTSSDKTTFHPNRTSYINPEHLSFFKFIGRIIGKAIFDGCFLDCHFSRAVYKRLLSRPVSLKDMETLDLDYFKSLMWMMENDITDVITENFSVETDDYGEHKIIDLIENGRNVPVTEENKNEYVRKVVEYRLQTSVAEQMDHFLEGFHDIIPENLVVIFDEQELELLISGLPDISVVDWQNNTVYTNYSASSMQIQWFWRAVKSFDNEERAKLLQFATGTSKVPLNGFKELSGSDGTCKFSIHRDYCALDRLPSSHTCFNQIDLPAYESYETLRGSLLMAITEGHEGFGLA